MKALLITIGFCVVVLSGCTEQFSNGQETSRRISERRDYDVVYQSEDFHMDGYDKETLEYGPRIDLIKAIWGRKSE